MENFWNQNLPDSKNPKKDSEDKRAFENALAFSRRIDFALDVYNYHQPI